MGETATVAATSGLSHRSGGPALRARQDSNLRVTALETVALPLSYGRIPGLRTGNRCAPSRIRTCDPPIKSRWLWTRLSYRGVKVACPHQDSNLGPFASEASALIR